MQLTPFCLMLSCLQVSPDRSQYFRYDSLSLSCQDPLNSTGWKVKRRTPGGGVRVCSNGWGSTSSGPTCIIGNTYPSDSGEYWCESDNGDISDSVNITITDRAVILESPALPVLEGDAVILRCRAETKSSDHRFTFYKDGRAISINSTGEMTIHRVFKSDEGLYKCGITGGGESVDSWLAVEGRAVILESPALPVSEGDAVILRCKAATNSSDHRFEFHKDGQSFGSSSTGEMTIHRASKSDEGFYKCSISGSGESVSSWLAVEASLPHSSPTPSAASSSVPVSRLMCHLMVGTPYLLSTILLGLIYRDRKRAARIIAERRGSNDVIMEIIV